MDDKPDYKIGDVRRCARLGWRVDTTDRGSDQTRKAEQEVKRVSICDIFLESFILCTQVSML